MCLISICPCEIVLYKLLWFTSKLTNLSWAFVIGLQKLLSFPFWMWFWVFIICSLSWISNVVDHCRKMIDINLRWPLSRKMGYMCLSSTCQYELFEASVVIVAYLFVDNFAVSFLSVDLESLSLCWCSHFEGSPFPWEKVFKGKLIGYELLWYLQMLS